MQPLPRHLLLLNKKYQEQRERTSTTALMLWKVEAETLHSILHRWAGQLACRIPRCLLATRTWLPPPLHRECSLGASLTLQEPSPFNRLRWVQLSLALLWEG